VADLACAVGPVRAVAEHQIGRRHPGDGSAACLVCAIRRRVAMRASSAPPT